jgi:hypothetical protein
MTTLPLTFGAELECFLPMGMTHRTAAERIARDTGLAVTAESYNHLTRPTWKIVPDGSLGDYQRGAEIVSPILSGEEGIEALAKVCRSLTEMGAKVNKRCGYHVHVGMRGESLETWKNIIRAYAAFEAQIDNLMPTSRRANNNNYCRSIASINHARLDAATDLSGIDRAINLAGMYDRRYAKVNLQSYHRHGTVEFRQHSGTVDAEKATNWVRFILAMVEAARKGKRPGIAATTATVQARPGSKTALAGAMLTRQGGCTRQEILAATGWPTVSVQQVARSCGIALRQQREGREVRYFAVGDQTASLENLLTMIEANDNVARFYTGRATALRAA